MIDSVIRALGMAVAMGWDILRPLSLGFALSAVVKAAVSKQQMSWLLPDDRPRSIATALALGAAWSSCFYAAVTLARSIFRKGAHFTPAMAFEMAAALQQLHSRPVRAQYAGGRSLHQLELYDWLNLVFLVLVQRFLKTGGPAMLSMMNRAVNHGDPTTMLISWTIRLLNHLHWSNGTTASGRPFHGVACGFFDNLAGYAQCSPRSPLRVAWQATESATSLDVNGALTTSKMNESSSSFGHDAVNSVN